MEQHYYGQQQQQQQQKDEDQDEAQPQQQVGNKEQFIRTNQEQEKHSAQQHSTETAACLTHNNPRAAAAHYQPEGTTAKTAEATAATPLDDWERIFSHETAYRTTELHQQLKQYQQHQILLPTQLCTVATIENHNDYHGENYSNEHPEKEFSSSLMLGSTNAAGVTVTTTTTTMPVLGKRKVLEAQGDKEEKESTTPSSPTKYSDDNNNNNNASRISSSSSTTMSFKEGGLKLLFAASLLQQKENSLTTSLNFVSDSHDGYDFDKNHEENESYGVDGTLPTTTISAAADTATAPAEHIVETVLADHVFYTTRPRPTTFVTSSESTWGETAGTASSRIIQQQQQLHRRQQQELQQQQQQHQQQHEEQETLSEPAATAIHNVAPVSVHHQSDADILCSLFHNPPPPSSSLPQHHHEQLHHHEQTPHGMSLVPSQPRPPSVEEPWKSKIEHPSSSSLVATAATERIPTATLPYNATLYPSSYNNNNHLLHPHNARHPNHHHQQSDNDHHATVSDTNTVYNSSTICSSNNNNRGTFPSRAPPQSHLSMSGAVSTTTDIPNPQQPQVLYNKTMLSSNLSPSTSRKRATGCSARCSDKKDAMYSTTEPNDNDVLCGRGGLINKHYGNVVYRRVVEYNKPIYKSVPKRHRILVSQSIVQTIMNVHGGRFLQPSSYQEQEAKRKKKDNNKGKGKSNHDGESGTMNQHDVHTSNSSNDDDDDNDDDEDDKNKDGISKMTAAGVACSGWSHGGAVDPVGASADNTSSKRAKEIVWTAISFRKAVQKTSQALREPSHPVTSVSGGSVDDDKQYQGQEQQQQQQLHPDAQPPFPLDDDEQQQQQQQEEEDCDDDNDEEEGGDVVLSQGSRSTNRGVPVPAAYT